MVAGLERCWPWCPDTDPPDPDPQPCGHCGATTRTVEVELADGRSATATVHGCTTECPVGRTRALRTEGFAIAHDARLRCDVCDWPATDAGHCSHCDRDLLV